MKVAGNRVQHLIDYYHSELDALYGREETSAIVAAVLDHYLSIKRSEIASRANEHMNQSDLLLIYDCCKALKTGKPLQQVLQTAWFYDLRLFVNEQVLIPRPETEELADMIIRENPACKSLLDIGTGSGCIPLAVKSKLSSCEVFGCDISCDALNVAVKNAESLNLKLTLFQADVLNEAEFLQQVTGRYEVIVSNPPYIKISESHALHTNVREHEPHLALFVDGEDDIVFYRRIIHLCENILHPGGKLYFELNPLTAEDVRRCAEQSALFESAELHTDMSGKLRFLKAIRR